MTTAIEDVPSDGKGSFRRKRKRKKTIRETTRSSSLLLLLTVVVTAAEAARPAAAGVARYSRGGAANPPPPPPNTSSNNYPYEQDRQQPYGNNAGPDDWQQEQQQQQRQQQWDYYDPEYQEPPQQQTDYYPPQQQGSPPEQSSSFTPPPPPPEVGSSSSRNPNPIHYNFKAKDGEYASDDGDRHRRRGRELPSSQSARRDAVTVYWSSGTKQRVSMSASAGLVGAGTGLFVTKSMLGGSAGAGMIGGGALFLLIAVAFGRSAYGDLVRALGLALIRALQRTRRIRRRYPTMRHIKASLGVGRRQYFPPLNKNNDDSYSPWTYAPRQNSDDVPFQMMFCLLAFTLVGAVCGGNIQLVLVPAWLGGLVGAGSCAFATTINSARGDLARTMGMRVVALAQEVWFINDELELVTKAGVVAGRILDKVMILDRKHRIKDRLAKGFSFLAAQVTRTASQMQQDLQQPPPQQRRDEGPFSEQSDPSRRRRVPESREGGRFDNYNEAPRGQGDEYNSNDIGQFRERQRRNRQAGEDRNDDDKRYEENGGNNASEDNPRKRGWFN